ncbi:MAG: copper homeostasis periplasmic binding protein CopC [Pseudomonas sp.]
MSFMKIAAVSIVLYSGLLMSIAANAHSRLVSSVPMEGDEAVATTNIELHFSETLLPQFSTAKLFESHGSSFLSMVKVTASGSKDLKTLILIPSNPLESGNYRLEWRVVSSDTHPVSGSIKFKVK